MDLQPNSVTSDRPPHAEQGLIGPVQRDADQPGRYIGLDLGTSGCRAVAIDDAGEVLAEARATLPASRHPESGHSEQDPADWWQAARTVLTDVVERCEGAATSLAVDGTSSSLLLCDKNGAPCAPALMYDDGRAQTQAARIAANAPEDSPARGAGSALSKLLYLLERHGDRAAHALHQADWIAGRLSGHYGISDENNCLKLGYDPIVRRWPDWINALIPNGERLVGLLPRVVAAGTPIGKVSSQVSRSVGLTRDAVLVAGTTDSNAAALAAGISNVGDAVTSLGTTLVVKILSDHPVFAARYGVYSHRLGDRWLVGGSSNSGGAVLRQHFSDAKLHELSERIDPETSSGLAYYPLPRQGERFPICDATLEPRLSPRPDDPALFLKALFEGIATIEAKGYAKLAELGAPAPKTILSSGGGASNPVWQRIRERTTGVPVHVAARSEAAYGTALLARAAAIRPR